jgi:hypothetical protein
MNNDTEWSGRILSEETPETFTWRYEDKTRNSSFVIVRYPVVTWNKNLQGTSVTASSIGSVITLESSNYYINNVAENCFRFESQSDYPQAWENVNIYIFVWPCWEADMRLCNGARTLLNEGQSDPLGFNFSQSSQLCYSSRFQISRWQVCDLKCELSHAQLLQLYSLWPFCSHRKFN